MRITGEAEGKAGSGRNVSKENMRILIADNEPVFLHGLRASIEGSYQIVGEADTGQEVLSLLSLHQPCLLIIGFRLACGRDALGLVSEFRSSSPDTSIIVFLPRNSAAFIGRLLDAGVRGILSRSSPIAAILPAIGKVLAWEMVLAPSLTTLGPRPSTRSPRNSTTPRSPTVSVKSSTSLAREDPPRTSPPCSPSAPRQSSVTAQTSKPGSI